MKKIAFLGLALAVAGGTFVLVKKQTCGSCCHDAVQESTTVAGGNASRGRVAANGQK
jgi:hypothetical protein